jgi:hypothetical protein
LNTFRQRKIDTRNIGHKIYLSMYCAQWFTSLSLCVLCPLLPVSICMCLVSIVTRVYLSVSCAQCYTCLSFCVLCPMLPVSIFLCLVSNVTRVYLSVSCVQCYPFLSFCVLCPMLTVSISLWGNIGHKTQKDRHGKHWAQETKR